MRSAHTSAIRMPTLAALLGCALLLSINANLYSQSVVSYINLPSPPGFSLFGYPLIGSPNNDLAYALDNISGEFNGCQIFFWQNGTWATYIANNNPAAPIITTNGWIEPDGPITLPPGAGAVFFNSTTVTVELTFVGTIQFGSLTNTLNPGLNLVSSMIPMTGDLSSNAVFSFPSLAGGQFDGDQVFFQHSSANGAGGFTMFTVDSLSYGPPANHGWDGLPGQPDPVITYIGQAF
jgi:hypothetical protein